MRKFSLRKIAKWISLCALAGVVLLQLTNPARTNPPVAHDFLASTSPPPGVAALFRSACYDCHSHETRWPWYSHVAPVSWGIVGDVNLARSEMDLSTWPADNTDRAVRTLDAMSEKLKSHAMPLTRYTLLHREARLTENQRTEMVDWLTSTAAKLNQPPSKPPALPPVQIDSSAGRVLFLKNCAHCHGADGHGDDGPDLHNLDESNEWIANRIRTGKKGQMTAFAGKLSPTDIDSLVTYVHTLK